MKIVDKKFVKSAIFVASCISGRIVPCLSTCITKSVLSYMKMHMEQQRQLIMRERQQKQAAAAMAASSSSSTSPATSDSTRSPAAPSLGASNTQQQQQQQANKRQLTLTVRALYIKSRTTVTLCALMRPCAHLAQTVCSFGVL